MLRAADHTLTAELKTALPTLFKQEAHRYMCFPCGCATGYCFRVMRIDSAMKSLQRRGRLRLPCPLCDQNSGDAGTGRSSSHVTAFAAIVRDSAPTAKIIWDWNCILASTRMSIDATVWCGQRCAQFEIDGSNHFVNNLTSRQESDAEKDA